MMAVSPALLVDQDATDVVTANSPNGSSVVVWVSEDTNAANTGVDDFDVMAQLYGSGGDLIGLPITVASQSYKEYDPAVAMDADGNFVVTWTEAHAGINVKAKWFDAIGSPTHGDIYVASSSEPEGHSSVAMDAEGNSVVTYTVGDGDDKNVWARAFLSNGAPDNSSIFNGNFGVGNTAFQEETTSSIARAADGRFAIVYQTSANDVRMRYIAAGVNTAAKVVDGVLGELERNPDIAMDANGNGVVVWSESTGEIKARRFDNNGNLAGDVLLIVGDASSSARPSVALTNDGNAFLVAFEKGSGSNTQVYYALINNNGGDAVQVVEQLADDGQNPDVSVTGFDQFIVSYDQPLGSQALMHHIDPVDDGGFQIQLNFVDNGAHTWSLAEKDLMREAADLWEQVIIGDLPNVMIDNARIDGVLTDNVLVDDLWVDARWFQGGDELAHAEWTSNRGGWLPSRGTLEFNTDFLLDENWFGNPDQFRYTARHEIGHILGLGRTLWEDFGLVQGIGTADPIYVGPQAVARYNEIRLADGLSNDATSMPLEYDPTDNGGSNYSHWSEDVFETELMTPRAEFPIGGVAVAQELSIMTVGALGDLGYEVNYNAAEEYHLPSSTSSATSVSPGPEDKSNLYVHLDEHEDGDDGKTDYIEVVDENGSVQIWINGELDFTFDADNVFQIIIIGTADNDYVTAEADLGIHVFFDGMAGYDRLTIEGTLGTDTVDVWTTQVDVNSTTYAFSDLEYLRINTRFGNSTTTVHSFPQVSAFIARGDFLHDVYRINTTSLPSGYVSFQGGSGNNTLEAANRNNTWDIYSTGYGRLNSSLSFVGMDNLEGGSLSDEFVFSTYGRIEGTVDGGGGTDQLDYSGYNLGAMITILSPTTLTASQVGGVVSSVEGVIGSNTLNDRITGPNALMYWYITGDNSGYLRNYSGYAPFTFSSVETLNGGAHNDTFRFYGDSTISGDIIGRNGTDTLYFASYNQGDGSGVFVDLLNRSSTSVGGQVALIENVTGSRYDDVIRGDDQANVLNGYRGNDVILGLGGNDSLYGSYYDSSILIGGAGADYIRGGRSDDLIVAGSTVYDLRDEKILLDIFGAIRETWTQSKLDTASRISALRSGVITDAGNKASLNSKTVVADKEYDWLQGSEGEDWFWSAYSEISDFEKLTDLLN